MIDVQTSTVALAAEIAEQAGASPPEVNLGGGFGIPYFPGDQPLDIEAVGTALAKTLAERPEILADTQFAIELGRWLVGEAGVYLTRIVDRKESRGETFLVTDGGLHHMLAARGNFGQLLRRNYPVAIADRFGAEPDEDATITGCLCTPLDLLAHEVALPRAERGRSGRDLLRRRLRPEREPAGVPEPATRPRNPRLGVDRLDEIEAFGRRIEAELGAVAGFERAPDVVRLPLAAPDQRQAADHRAHLVVEEAARGGLDVDLLADAPHVQPVERLHRAVRLALDRAEGGEVVPADEHRRTFGHRLDIQRHGDVPHAAAIERRRRAAIEDAVQIVAPDA